MVKVQLPVTLHFRVLMSLAMRVILAPAMPLPVLKLKIWWLSRIRLFCMIGVFRGSGERPKRQWLGRLPDQVVKWISLPVFPQPFRPGEGGDQT